MPKKPTTKQQKKLVEGIAKGLSIKEAGERAGYGRVQSAHRAYKMLRMKFHPALEAKGYSAEQVLNAIFMKMWEKMEAKDTVFFDYQGVVMETREIIPHDTQLKAANDLARFFGIISNGHDDPGTTPQPHSITVNLAFLGPERAAKVLATAREQSSGRDSGQPVVDAESDQDEGRPGPKGTV